MSKKRFVTGRLCRRISVMLLAGLLLLVHIPSLTLADEAPRVLRVAFPQVPGITETAEDGTRKGLVVDYLNEISKYTGWVYEYVDVDDAGEMLAAFDRGEYDLMGGQYYFEGLEMLYAYPEHNTGYSRATLLARNGDSSILSNNIESLNGKVIGVYERANENIRRLKEYLSMNKIKCDIRSYTQEELKSSNDLLDYLEKGEIDLLLGNLKESSEKFRVAFSYESQPYYIVTNVGNKEVLDGLNMALERITDANPNFAEQCYAANFPDLDIAVQLTEGEKEYVANRDVVIVAVPKDWHPLCCQSVKKDLHDGLVLDMLKEIESFSGLKFSCVYTENYIDAVRLVQQKEADVLGFFLGAEAEAVEQGLALSAPYARLNNIIIRNKSISYPDDNLKAALIDGRTLPKSVSAAESVTFDSAVDALAAVNSGDVDFIYGVSARLEQEIQNYHFTNLVPVTLVNEIEDIFFAMERPADADLLTIINKAINNLTADEKSKLRNKNMVTLGASEFSLLRLIYANPVAFGAVLVSIVLIAAAVLLLFARARMKAAIMESNLAKAESESRAKGEFLSRMSHEIRTPMNAVVGLADIASMADNVPEDVRLSLSKIRTSSKYLLELINDVLDMGRIESGMMSVSSEPFSIEEVLSSIYTMMESEAQRRNINFVMEKELVHSDVIGDAIRLRQVLMNLLSNAFKFTPEGGRVILSVREIKASGSNITMAFEVCDTGVGIPKEDQQRIFVSFEQLGNSSSQSQGTGLGLPISRSIVRLMGGDLCVESEPGMGSRFYFNVTFLAGSAGEGLNELASKALFKGVHILLAEDNDLNAEITIRLLEIQGAEVFRSQDGLAVLERFKSSEPGEFQLILMDVQMPVMDGLSATRAVRALDRPDAKEIPIVAMTANSFKADVDATYDAGMNAFISKPFDVEHLYGVMADVLKIESE